MLEEVLVAVDQDEEVLDACLRFESVREIDAAGSRRTIRDSISIARFCQRDGFLSDRQGRTGGSRGSVPFLGGAEGASVGIGQIGELGREMDSQTSTSSCSSATLTL